MSTWQTIKGYAAGVIALIACPCHLPLTLPLLIALTARTALGSWLAGNYLTVFIISPVIFIGGLILSFRWLGREAILQSRGAARSPWREATTVILVTSTACQSCAQAKEVWQEVLRGQPVRLEVVEINSPRGRRLAARHNIFTTPMTLINGRMTLCGVPSLEEARRAVGNA